MSWREDDAYWIGKDTVEDFGQEHTASLFEDLPRRIADSLRRRPSRLVFIAAAAGTVLGCLLKRR